MQYKGYIFSVTNEDDEDYITLFDHKNYSQYSRSTGRHIYVSELVNILDALVYQAENYKPMPKVSDPEIPF